MIDKDYRSFAKRMGELYKITYDVEIGFGRTHEQADKFTKRIIACTLQHEAMFAVSISDVPADKKAEEEKTRARLINKFSKKWDMPIEELNEAVDIMINAIRETEEEFGETA